MCTFMDLTFTVCFCERLTRTPEWFSGRRRSLALDTERENWDSMFSLHEQRTDMKLKNEPGIFSRTHRQDYPWGMEQSVGEKAIPEETHPEAPAARTNHKVLRQQNHTAIDPCIFKEV